MFTFVIEGCAPWNGRYDFDDLLFTQRELHEIKKLSGVRAGELIEALQMNDAAAYVGVGMVVLARHGKNPDPDDLWNTKGGSLDIELKRDGAADPPTMPAAPAATPSGDGGSGDASSNAGDLPVKTP